MFGCVCLPELPAIVTCAKEARATVLNRILFIMLPKVIRDKLLLSFLEFFGFFFLFLTNQLFQIFLLFLIQNRIF